MGVLSLTLPIIGQPDSTEDPKINSAFGAIQTWANGNIDTTNLSTAAKTALMFSPGAPSQPSRAFAAAYQPNASRPTLLVTAIELVGAASASITIGPTSVPTTLAAFVSSPSSMYAMATVIVPAGWYYQGNVGSGSAAFDVVTEFTL